MSAPDTPSTSGQATLCVKWNGQEYTLHLYSNDTVGSLKRELEAFTEVPVKRQKLLGLKTKDKKLAGDDVLVADLEIKANAKVMMMGSREADIEAAAAASLAAPEVQDDFDLRPDEEQAMDIADRPEVQEKLQRRIANVTVKVLNPPRAGKKCLVLDIDYTLFDLGSTAERPEELARPYLHEFLAAAFPFYDIVIWSATSMKWVEVKMRELGVLTHPDYKLVCMLDHRAMVTVPHPRRGGVFDCKPLAFLWAKFPEHYSPDNTIMMDDLRRNFIMNKQNGLVIRPYHKAHINRSKDQELFLLSRYLTLIGNLESLAHLDHRKWERYLERFGGGV